MKYYVLSMTWFVLLSCAFGLMAFISGFWWVPFLIVMATIIGRYERSVVRMYLHNYGCEEDEIKEVLRGKN